VTKGPIAPEVEKACYRARDLSQRIGDSPHLFAILGGLNSIYYSRGELATALELANQMLSLAERKDDPVRLVWAHHALGLIFDDLGEFSSSRHHFEKSIAHYDFQGHHNYGWVQDPGACGLSMLAALLQMLGYPQQALEKHRESMDWARRIGNPNTLQFVLTAATRLYFERGEFKSALGVAEERIAICTKHGFEPELRAAMVLRGLALTHLSRNDEGIEQILQTWEGLEAKTTDDFDILYLIAEAYWRYWASNPRAQSVRTSESAFEQGRP